jgi:glycosyltransferase involved in cell wall biosynthesis
MNSNSKPKVSVVIPNYNHARFLQRRIESVLGQRFQDFEVILIDDCSTDDSQSLISSFAGDLRFRIAFNAINSGSTFKQWNKGVGMARGEYVWIAESDDYANSQLLERLVAVLETEPEVAFVYCRSWRVSEDDQLDGFEDSNLVELDPQRWTADYRAEGREECRNYFVYRNIVPNASAVLFRRSAYERVGGADESLRLGGDWKLWAAMALTWRIAYLGEPLNYFRFHGESVRGKDAGLGLAAEENLYVVRWLLGQVSISDDSRGKMCRKLSELWIPPVITGHLPFVRRWAILRNAMAIDPHALRRLLRTASLALIRNNVPKWLWHPVREAMRSIWCGLGLRQWKVRPVSKQTAAGREKAAKP